MIFAVCMGMMYSSLGIKITGVIGFWGFGYSGKVAFNTHRFITAVVS
jgi:hypothetical protein